MAMRLLEPSGAAFKCKRVPEWEMGPTGTRVRSKRHIASLACAGSAVIVAAILLSGCATENTFPAVHDMPADRSETKLTPDQVKQATDDLISERDRTEAQAAPVTTGSIPKKKSAASAQPAAQPASSGISAYAKQ